MVKYAENVSHQLSPDGGSYLTVKQFAISGQQNCTGTDGRFYSDFLSKPSGRNKSIGTVASDMQILVSGSRNQYMPQISPYNGQEKILAASISRQGSVLQTEWPMRQTVVVRVFHHWDCPMMELFAFFQNKNCNTVLFADGSSESFCNRCNVNFLAKHI